MTTAERPATPESMDAEIAKLRREIAAAAGEARSAIEERITALCAARDGIRQQAVAATGRELVALERDRATAEQAVAAATSATKAAAEAKLTQVRSALQAARDRFQLQAAAIVRDTGEELAILSVRVDAANGAAKQALASTTATLRAKRDVIQAKLSALPGMAAVQWQAAKADFDVAMQELSSLRDRGMSGIN
jgi:hypothetical protein